MTRCPNKYRGPSTIWWIDPYRDHWGIVVANKHENWTTYDALFSEENDNALKQRTLEE